MPQREMHTFIFWSNYVQKHFCLRQISCAYFCQNLCFRLFFFVIFFLLLPSSPSTRASNKTKAQQNFVEGKIIFCKEKKTIKKLQASFELFFTALPLLFSLFSNNGKCAFKSECIYLCVSICLLYRIYF